MTAPRKFTEAVGERYRRSDQNEKGELLEFVEVTGYHRKHVIRATSHRRSCGAPAGGLAAMASVPSSCSARMRLLVAGGQLGFR